MIKIDSSSDNILNVNYDFFKCNLSDLKILAKSWYEGIDIKSFDKRWVLEKDEPNLSEMKKSGLICNLFFAYIEDDKYYLLDGFNRLFTDYGAIQEDTIVYLKVITTKLSDHQLMETMYRLNMWKLYESNRSFGGFKIDTFFDRGFRLLLHCKFGIDFYSYTNVEYDKRTRANNDLDLVDQYFVSESDYSASFKTSYEGVNILMSQPNILNDIKSIVKGNDCLKQPFNNYFMFLEGYARYLAYLRYMDNSETYDFDYFLDKLYANKSFFKKLVGMSGNDSTRKNIYNFYRNLNLHISN
jgi:hypothetical protein